MDEYEEHDRWIRRLERERVTPPPKALGKPNPDTPEATAARRKALEKAVIEHERSRHLKAVGE